MSSKAIKDYKGIAMELVSRSRFKDCDIRESLIGVDVWLERIA
jgi:hypothetical protein